MKLSKKEIRIMKRRYRQIENLNRLDKNYNAQILNLKVCGGKAFAAEQKRIEFKKLLSKVKLWIKD